MLPATAILSFTYLQHPGTGTREGIAGVDDVTMFGERGEEILEALLQSVDLGVDQHFCNQILSCVLDQTLSCRRRRGRHGGLVLVGKRIVEG